MTSLREAAQAALESLQELNGWQSLAPPAASRAAVQPAINLSAALAEEGLQRLTDVSQEIEAALAEPVQEPVAWMVYTLDGKSVCVTDNPADFTDEHRVLPLYTAPPQRTEEPVPDSKHATIAEWWADKRCPNCAGLQDQNTELDRKLAEMECKPLTDDEICSLFRTAGSPTAFARAIERAHGIKDA